MYSINLKNEQKWKIISRGLIARHVCQYECGEFSSMAKTFTTSIATSMFFDQCTVSIFKNEQKLKIVSRGLIVRHVCQSNTAIKNKYFSKFAFAATKAKWLACSAILTFTHLSKWPSLKVASSNPGWHLEILFILWQGLKCFASFRG